MTEFAIKERFVQAFDVLLHQNKTTQKALAESLGMASSYISIIRKRDNAEVKASYIANIVAHGKISPFWLLLGTGEMFGQEPTEEGLNEKIERILANTENIQYNVEEIVKNILRALVETKIPRINFSKT